MTISSIPLPATQWTPAQAAEAFDTLHYATMQRQRALQLFYDVTHFFHADEDISKDVQHLWLKLHRKYKFKFKEYEKLQLPTSIHTGLFNASGHGFQTIMRFYDERKLSAWQLHLFEDGLHTLLQGERFQNLALYFCNTLICEEWAAAFHSQKLHDYFLQHPQPKVKELYNASIHYKNEQTAHSATDLYKLLKSLNPHYRLEAKATPALFKLLYEQKY